MKDLEDPFGEGMAIRSSLEHLFWSPCTLEDFVADMYREIQEDAMCAIQGFFWIAACPIFDGFSRLWKFNELLELKGAPLIITC